MPDLRLQENEIYIRRSGSRFYKDRYFSLGYLFLTNQRLVYHRTSRIIMLAVAVIPAAAILLIFQSIYKYPLSLAYLAGLVAYTIFRNKSSGRFAFDIPLQDIGGIEKGTVGRKKDILTVTRKDGTQLRLSVDNNSFWYSEIKEAMKKYCNIDII